MESIILPNVGPRSKDLWFKSTTRRTRARFLALQQRQPNGRPTERGPREWVYGSDSQESHGHHNSPMHEFFPDRSLHPRFPSGCFHWGRGTHREGFPEVWIHGCDSSVLSTPINSNPNSKFNYQQSIFIFLCLLFR